MTKFNVGDRVEFRASTPDTAYAPYGDGDAPTHLNGSRGTVVGTAGYASTIRVNWDEDSAARRAYEAASFSKDASNAASFTENLILAPEPEPEPERIPVGTRAKALTGEYKGATGEITNDDGTDLWEYTLRFDEPRDGVNQEIYSKRELEVLPDDPKPVTPASLRDQAVAKRAEATEITRQITELVDKRSTFLREASDLEAAAQTIERLGGTK